MIRIELAQRHDGADMAAATWNGAEFTAAHPRSSALRIAARNVRDTDVRMASTIWQPFPVRRAAPPADFGEGGRYGGSGELPRAAGGADLGAVSREVGR